MDDLRITDHFSVPMAEIEMKAVRSQGAGGQNVNKVSTAIQLRFNLAQSPSVPENVRRQLLASGDQRITTDGVVVIKSQESRSQERNRQLALQRLCDLLRDACREQKPRIATRPGSAAKRKRLDEKSRRGNLKALRRKPPSD